jgi:capsular polysaccharide biosynthesis protein
MAGMLAGLGYSLVREPVYTADAYGVVVAEHAGDAPQVVNFAQAYARIVTEPGLLATAQHDPYLSSGDLLKRTLQVSASPDAPLVRLSATAPAAEQAAERANVALNALVLYANRHSTDTGVRLTGFARATAPVSPSSPVPMVNVGVGLAAAVLIAGLAWLAPLPRPSRVRGAEYRAPRGAAGDAPRGANGRTVEAERLRGARV